MKPKEFTISTQHGKYFAALDGFKFYIGSETFYQGNYGLYNYNVQDGPVYNPEDYEQQYGHWAWFIYPTVQCESKGSFHCLNTYDRAVFTFTMMQFAAHVPNGDFVIYLRKLLQLPDAPAYFPYLELRNGRIWYHRNGNSSQLENDNESGTVALMKYLNPNSRSIDNQELITAARFVHWAQNSKPHQDLQVRVAIDIIKNKMRKFDQRFNLNKYPDYICQTISDIFHQGRSKYTQVENILNSSSNPEAINGQLLSIGESIYSSRIKTLKNYQKKLKDSGILIRHYDSKSNSFI